MKQKDLGKSRLHFSLQTSMISTAASNANESGSSSFPCGDLSLVGDDFEKLSLGLHQQPALQNGACLSDGGGSSHDAPHWFLTHITKMEENLRQAIHQEVQQCLRDVLKENLNGQAYTEKSQRPSDTLNENCVDTDTSNSVRQKAVPAAKPLHLGITCDHCEQPICGIRFKCGNCVDYDLCETCENIPGVHQTDHIFLKIRWPTCLATCRKKGERHKSLLKHLYPQLGQTGTQGTSNEPFRCRKREKKVKRWLTHAENVFLSSGYGNPDHRSGYRSGLAYGNRPSHILSHIQSQSLHARHNTTAQSKQQNFSVRCLTDVSPGTMLNVQPGQEFEKEWHVRNDSLVQFPATYRLRFSWGSLVPQGQVEVSVPPLKPGETGKVGPIHFRAPQQEGMYHSHWLLVSHPGGMPFPSPSLSCPVRVSWEKEGLHNEDKEADTVSTPIASNVIPEDVVDVFKRLNDAATTKFPSNNSKTTDPEETDDTASILSISSCESDEDYVKVQGPAQLIPLTQLHTTTSPSKGAHLKSQETSSSSVDLLMDMPLNEDENEHRHGSLVAERASSEAPSTVAAEASLPNSNSRSSLPSLNENHFAAAGHSDNIDTQDETGQIQPSKSQASSQPLRNDQTNQPEVVIPVLPEALVTGALTAAASVYNTAKAIISTLQPPTDGPPGPILVLTEMGFHDRALNQRLLSEYGGCLEDVIAELIRLRADHGPNY